MSCSAPITLRSLISALTLPTLLCVACGDKPKPQPKPQPKPVAKPRPAPTPRRAPRQVDGPKQFAVTAHELATRAALDALRQGGNAMDAALTAGLVLAVVEPHSSGLGGGGFLLSYDAKQRRVEALDFRERAPQAATPTMYLAPAVRAKQPSRVGHLAAGTPGQIAGFAAAAKRYASFPWKRLVEPARRLAEGGFPVYGLLREIIIKERRKLGRFPASAAIFLPGGKAPAVGSTLKQANLAKTLRRLQDKGPQSFYEGRTAALLVQEMKRGGGILAAADLAGYRPRWTTPVKGQYRGHTLYSMGSPSSGGTHVVQILQILEGFGLGKLRPTAPRRLHLVAEAMRRAFADRAHFQGDASFVKVPTAGLLSPAYAATLRRSIHLDRAAPKGSVKAGRPPGAAPPPARPSGAGEGRHTSHLCVVDRQGNAVSMTLTINTHFGSGVVAAGTGVVLNNEMDDFAAFPGKPNAFELIQGDKNRVQAGKSPLSSMAPTLVFQGPKLRGLLGAAGGPRIITTVVQLLLNLIDHGMSARQAMHHPRIHHQWRPQRLDVEKPLAKATIAAALRKLGHTVRARGPWANAALIWRDQRGQLTGAADPRRVGTATGF